MRRYWTFERLPIGAEFHFREGVLGNLLADRVCCKMSEDTYRVLPRPREKLDSYTSLCFMTIGPVNRFRVCPCK